MSLDRDKITDSDLLDWLQDKAQLRLTDKYVMLRAFADPGRAESDGEDLREAIKDIMETEDRILNG